MTASREDVYQHLVEVHGEEGARAIMAMLPPSRWEDLATKADLRALEARFDGIDDRLDGITHRLDAIDARFTATDERFSAIDNRFTAIEHRFDGTDQRIMSLEHSLSGQMAALQTSIEGELATLRAVMVSGRQIALTMAASVAAIGALAVALAALLA